MPRRGRKAIVYQSVFFVTTTTKEWRPFFESHDQCTRLRNIIAGVVVKYHAKLYGYVLMPNHIHLLVQVAGGGPRLSEFMRDIKSLSARQLFPDERGIWMPRFDDVAIYTEKQFLRKLQYIHNNPVKLGLVARSQDYLFSSATSWLLGEIDGLVTTTFFPEELSGGDA